MNKKGQLGALEFKFFMIGLAIGIAIAITLLVLSVQDIIPFGIPWVCG